MSKNLILSICIPTYNRANYLSELLDCIHRNVVSFPEILNEIEVNIFDNNSPDNTSRVVEYYQKKIPCIKYIHRNENIGADPNIAAAYKENNGKYVWVIGDDDLITDDGVYEVFKLIKESSCDDSIPGASMIIALDVFKEREKFFDSYADFAHYVYPRNVKYLLWHTLISSNIVRKDLIDFEFGQKMIPELYGHMYGIFNKLEEHRGKVVVVNNVITVRTERAPFADLSILEIIHKKQRKYMEWLSRKLKLNSLIVSAVIFLLPKMMHDVKRFIKNFFRITTKYDKREIRIKIVIFGIKVCFKKEK